MPSFSCRRAAKVNQRRQVLHRFGGNLGVSETFGMGAKNLRDRATADVGMAKSGLPTNTKCVALPNRLRFAKGPYAPKGCGETDRS
jgi:hypothetical protein